MRIEAHTEKPPFATIPTDFAVVLRIINGERPCWPIAPARGHDVSAGIRELSESCWNPDPARRPTAQAIVKALALETSQGAITPQAPQSSPITSNVSIAALQEASKKLTSFSCYVVTQDRMVATAAADHGVNDGSGTSKLSKPFTH
jgi:hypothetical protein